MKQRTHLYYFSIATFLSVAIHPVASAQVVVEPTEPAEVGATEEQAAEVINDSAPVAEATEVSPVVEPVVVVEEEVITDTLVPKGEDERMSARSVGNGKIAFKPGKGLTIKSDDGDFELKTRVRLQLLYTIEKADGVDPMNELRLRRARVVFNGNAFGKHNKYKLEIDVLSDTPVLDYYLEFTKNRDISVRMGQYKLASNRTRVISSGNLQMIDRSIVNAEFTLDRDLGIDIRSKDFLGLDKLRYYLGVSMGQGKNNSSFQDFGMLYLARVEYLTFGMFDDYKESDFARTTTPRLSLGAAYAFHHRAAKTAGNIGDLLPDEGTTDYHYGYFDTMFKYAGFSAIGEVALRMGDRNVGPTIVDDNGDPVVAPAPRDGLGWMVQAGYLIPHQPFEVVGRYACVRDLGDNTSLSERKELALGFNWFLAQHPFKVQTDIAQLWGDKFSEGEFRLRVQLQASL